MEMHPGWRNDKMLKACQQNAIHVTVIPQCYFNFYGTLLHGLYSFVKEGHVWNNAKFAM